MTVTTPVAVNLWRDGPLSMSASDSTVPFRFTFIDLDTLQPVDPEVVIFESRRIPEEATWTALTYGVDAALVKDDVGEYHVDVVLDSPGKRVLRALAQTLTGTPLGSATTQAFAPLVAA